MYELEYNPQLNPNHDPHHAKRDGRLLARRLRPPSLGIEEVRRHGAQDHADDHGRDYVGIVSELKKKQYSISEMDQGAEGRYESNTNGPRQDTIRFLSARQTSHIQPRNNLSTEHQRSIQHHFI